jgi:hypothetical protein
MDVLTVNTAAQTPDEALFDRVCTRSARQPADAGGKEWLLRSADELDCVSGERMAESLEVVAAIAATVDGARRATNPRALEASPKSAAES